MVLQFGPILQGGITVERPLLYYDIARWHSRYLDLGEDILGRLFVTAHGWILEYIEAPGKTNFDCRLGKIRVTIRHMPGFKKIKIPKIENEQEEEESSKSGND